MSIHLCHFSDTSRLFCSIYHNHGLASGTQITGKAYRDLKLYVRLYGSLHIALAEQRTRMGCHHPSFTAEAHSSYYYTERSYGWRKNLHESKSLPPRSLRPSSSTCRVAINTWGREDNH